MRKQFYLDVTARLKLIVDGEDNPVFKHFDLWNSQFDADYQGYPLKFPCIFIEFLPIKWETLGRKRQAADLLFNIHIGSHTLAKSADGSHNINKALANLDLIDTIHFWLTGFMNDYISTISRIASKTDHYHAGNVDHVETYRCRVTDDSAVHTAVPVNVGTTLVINI